MIYVFGSLFFKPVVFIQAMCELLELHVWYVFSVLYPVLDSYRFHIFKGFIFHCKEASLHCFNPPIRKSYDVKALDIEKALIKPEPYCVLFIQQTRWTFQ